MNQKEMIDVLENARFAFQKFRSNAKETQSMTDDLDNQMLEDMWPWIFGPKCPLPAIQKVLDRGHVTGQEFYNFMVIMHQFCPEVMVAHSEFDFPKPSMTMIISTM